MNVFLKAVKPANAQWKIASMYLSHKYPNGSHYPGLYAPEIEVHEDCAEVSYR